MTDREPKIGDVIRCGGNRDGTLITVTVDDEWAKWLAECGGWVIVDRKPQEEPKQ